MKCLLWWSVLGIFAVLWQWYLGTYFIQPENHNKKCWQDFQDNITLCVPQCPNGSFSLPGMMKCHPWLSCNDNITIIEKLAQSVVKTIYLAEWNGYTVVISELSSDEYKKDFLQNLHLLVSLGPNIFTVQLLGYCNYTITTQYHKLGNALTLNYHLNNSLRQYNNMSVRLKLCISYASILHFLHSSPLGVRVMCDSNTLYKTLSQYLLTDDLQLVVNDLDATPQVDVTTRGVVCGPKQLYGTFVAPEQLWPYSDKKYNVTEMPLYDEKTDIWKLPDICNWFLGESSYADVIKFKLFNIHKKCKDKIPANRPSADTVLHTYKKIMSTILN